MYINSQNKVINCSDYVRETLSIDGFCFTFNSAELVRKRGSHLSVTRAGSATGASFRLNVHQDWYYIGSLESAGFRVGLFPV